MVKAWQVGSKRIHNELKMKFQFKTKEQIIIMIPPQFFLYEKYYHKLIKQRINP